MKTKSVMQINSHDNKTLIAILLSYVEEWRKSQNWSRATAAQVIVEAHTEIGGQILTGIYFNEHPDVYTRQTNNSDRVFRWLDDSTKDNNLLPANFILSILTALPMDFRIRFLNDVLSAVSVSCRPLTATSACLAANEMLKSIIKENNEAEMAIVDLIDGATKAELLKASKEVSDVIVVATDAYNRIENALWNAQKKDDVN